MDQTRADTQAEMTTGGARGLGVGVVYVLAGGVLLGVLLGPAALGRVSPAGYASLWGGGEARAAWRQELDAARSAAAAWAAVPGVSPTARSEDLQQRQLRIEARRTAMESVMDRRAVSLILAVGLALGGVMVGEALLAGDDRPGGPDQRGRGRGRGWRVVRYGLVGLGAAVLVARPTLAWGIAWGWALGLLAIGVAAGTWPWGRRGAG